MDEVGGGLNANAECELAGKGIELQQRAVERERLHVAWEIQPEAEAVVTQQGQ